MLSSMQCGGDCAEKRDIALVNSYTYCLIPQVFDRAIYYVFRGNISRILHEFVLTSTQMDKLNNAILKTEVSHVQILSMQPFCNVKQFIPVNSNQGVSRLRLNYLTSWLETDAGIGPCSSPNVHVLAVPVFSSFWLNPHPVFNTF